MHVHPPRTRLLFAAAAVLLGGVCGSCTHDYGLENRESPVHVWLTASDLAKTGGEIRALVYVGAEKAVEGPVRFPCGTPHVELPILYMTSGDKTVSAVFEGGAFSATEEVEVDGETWIQIVIRGRRVLVNATDEEPRQNLGQAPRKPTTRWPSPQGR